MVVLARFEVGSEVVVVGRRFWERGGMVGWKGYWWVGVGGVNGGSLLVRVEILLVTPAVVVVWLVKV